ncbi:MAG: hypothetical protein LBO03_00570 [Acidaminococcales bacterium]|jgi:hypothetical protein|nr:hypothetical protein [Acidaminococcales bacterium]MDR3348093.1 hypothetical protein [Acidaminococcales bacterium]
MDSEDPAALFARMDFFELEEEGSGAGYCYEPEEGGFYLIATNEAGDSPAPGDRIIVACYSPDDTFAWKTEFQNAGAFYAFRQKIGGPDLIGNLARWEKSANPGH